MSAPSRGGRWWWSGVALGACVCAVVLAEPSAGGIIVYETGKTVVGKIRRDEITEESVTIRWPYKGVQEGRGHQIVPRHRIRWFDADADEPTDAYWEEYVEAEIEGRWHSDRDDFLERQERRADGELPDDQLLIGGLGGGDDGGVKLSPFPVETQHFTVRKPEGWTSLEEDGITMLLAPEVGSGGVRPRIHVFAIESLHEETVDGQLEWMRRMLREFGTVDVEKAGDLEPQQNGFDMEMQTVTRREGGGVFALRKFMFRTKAMTYVFAAYCHEADRHDNFWLFQSVLESWTVLGASGGGERRRN